MFFIKQTFLEIKFKYNESEIVQTHHGHTSKCRKWYY
jgi:hypothetical protein